MNFVLYLFLPLGFVPPEPGVVGIAGEWLLWWLSDDKPVESASSMWGADVG